MSTLEKVKAERLEARERLNIERMYAEYDELAFPDVESGTVISFDWTPKDRVYAYAAIVIDGRWFVTGGQSPNGVPHEDFIAWLIGKDIEAADITWLAAS